MKDKVSALEFLNKHSKKFVLGAVVLAIIALAGMFYIWWASSGPIVTVNGNKITREDYNIERENFVKMSQFMDDPSLISDSSKITDYLIERKLLDIAAKEFSINVSDTEVDTEIDKNKDSFGGDVNSLKLSYEDAYGLTGEELETTVYYKLLKAKVSEKVIATKTGKYIYARFGTAGGVEEIAGVTTENLESWATSRTDGWVKQLESGKKFIDLYNEVMAENKYPASFATEFIEGPDSQSSGAEKEAINKLQEGQYGEIVKLDGYYAIFYLEEISGGDYDNWAAFIDDYTEKYVKFPIISAKTQNKLLNSFSLLKRIALDTFNIKTVEAACSSCSGCDGYYIQGYVIDSVTGYGISGASLGGVSAKTDYCNGSSSSSVVAWCGYRDGYASTDGGGYYLIPRWDGYSCRFNCAGGAVTLTAAKANYTSQVTSVSGTNGSGVSRNFYLVPGNRTLSVVIEPAGAGTVTGAGINCGTDCSETWAFSSSNTTITATPISGYAFSKFSIPGVDYTSNPLTVSHASNFTITAHFVPSNFTITPSADTGCTITPSTVQTVTAGSNSSAFTGYANTGYNFGGLSIDGGATLLGSPYTFSSVAANHTIAAKCTIIPILSCEIAPENGLSPLVIKVITATNISPTNLTYNFGDGVTVNDGTTVYHTYSNFGSYPVTVSDPGFEGGKAKACSPATVNVTNPSDGSGGEVAL